MRETSEKCVEFLQQLIRTESLPGREAEIADLVADEMRRLGFDEVSRDAAGNLIGVYKGQGKAPAMMFNTHLDHVDVGDPAAWPHPPYEAEVTQDRIWGRGAVDIKGPLAAQVHAVGGMISDKVRPPGDIYVTAVVQEETGGLGARHLVTHLAPPLVVVGEPSKCEVKRGHRGRSELILHVQGKSVHASIPEQAINPLEIVSRFVLGLGRLELQSDKELGRGTVAPTLIRTDQTSPNVTPGEVWLTCDCRTIPQETGTDVCEKLLALAELCLVEGASAQVLPSVGEQISYTGMNLQIPAEHPAFLVPSDHPAVQSAISVLKDAIGLEKPSDVWRFATDGGHFAKAGLTVIGFGPGDDKLAHTVEESIGIAELDKALAGNRALALKWPWFVRNRTISRSVS